ncbi:hypothetical protein GJ654_18685 [Rhodoblastus acidophilus]|uniref:HTH cro/C1-type domain-containing protein n=1 Tax=Rhodoblastus acidophilus TaxID=1074 RepID=A0A6N8DR21_RHOAC|nr:S24 family peptidase [Rhodoblastus acidophilus]MCW2276355.1 phage repressor protein C with HTH and peptisase S24 domain [Rhodoblastus acidophilus]MTV33010.1 hypothetical protein [Rhodoblastus acidophilus]
MKPATNPIVARIDQAREKLGKSREAVSLEAKMVRGYLQKMAERPHAVPKADTLARLATASGAPLDELQAIASGATPRAFSSTEREAVTRSLAEPPIPILGDAKGSALGAVMSCSTPIGYVARPPGLIGVEGAYAVFVQGDSMSPRHKNGELRFVHPYKQLNPGDDIIVQIVNAHHESGAFIKTFVAKHQKWLVCRQIAHDAEVKYPVQQVTSVHKVLNTNELFNV